MSESNRSASASDIEKFVAETDYAKQRAKEWYARVYHLARIRLENEAKDCWMGSY